MSLFALRRQYQRSIDRIFEDFSVHSQEQVEPSPEEVETDRYRSMMGLGDQRKRHLQRKTKSAMTYQAAGEYEFIHHDVNAWACFLDSKLKENPESSHTRSN
mgnify:CR=1 FL=1